MTTRTWAKLEFDDQRRHGLRGAWESDDWRWLVREDEDSFAVRDGAQQEWLDEGFPTFAACEAAIASIERSECGA